MSARDPVPRGEAVTRDRTERDERRVWMNHHRTMLLICLSAVILAFVLDTVGDERVAVRGLRDYPLPPSCPSYAYFGFECPGCGLTRSFIHFARGEWTTSLRRHRIGWLLALLVLFQVPYRAAALRRKDPAPLGAILPRIVSYVMIALLIGNWLFNVLTVRTELPFS